MKLNKIFSAIGAFAILALTAACSPGFHALPIPSQTANNANPALVSGGTLSLSPTTATVAPNRLLQFSASGGAAPHVYKLETGAGAIDADSGLYLAPATEGLAQVSVTDAAGTKLTANITISNSAATDPGSVLVVTWSPDPVQPDDVVTITTTGGTAPYTYTLESGAGVLNQNVYTADSAPETVIIKVEDSANNETTVVISVVSTANPNVPGSSVTRVDVLMPRTSTGQCNGQGTLSGTVAFMGGKDYRYAGEIQFCSSVESTASAEKIISDLWLTPSGQHRRYPTCPAGYKALGSFVDCKGGYCYGSQVLCGKEVAPASATQFVIDFYITPQGARAVSGAQLCATGYVSIGESTDCGGGRCQGAQQFCVKKQ